MAINKTKIGGPHLLEEIQKKLKMVKEIGKKQVKVCIKLKFILNAGPRVLSLLFFHIHYLLSYKHFKILII